MNNGQSIYLDYQSTTPLDTAVLSQMEPYFSREFGNPHSLEHAAGWAAAKAIDCATVSVAELIGADPDEIVFCSGATEANNFAILGYARRNLQRKRILLSSIEHKCVLEAARSLEQFGNYQIELIPVNGFGVIDLEWLANAVDEDVLLVSIMAVNNEIGTIQPLDEIGAITSYYGVAFHCDAAQAPCSMAIDVFTSKIDLLSLSGHKIYGPKGIGALYIRRALQNKIEPIIYGGGQQNGLRAGTLPVPLCVGLGAAADLLNTEKGCDERQRIGEMRDRFTAKIQKINSYIKVNGPPTSLRHSGNVNICFHGYNAQDILASSQPRLLASTGSACTSGISEASYVLRAIGLSDEAAKSSIRFSLGRFTTDKEIDAAVELLGTTLELLED